MIYLNKLTMRKELKFILRRIVFSICETRRKILSNSFSFSIAANNVDADPYIERIEPFLCEIPKTENAQTHLSGAVRLESSEHGLLTLEEDFSNAH